jgi:hypothetical protein
MEIYLYGAPPLKQTISLIKKGGSMTTVIYETDNAIFTFSLNDVTQASKTANQTEQLKRLLHHLTSSPPDLITIPKQNTDFAYIALDLIKKGKGSITCKTCNKTYRPDQLKLTVAGHGTSPFNLKEKGGIKMILKKGQRLPGLFGGRGFTCPKGHELISAITWRT